MNGRQKMTLDEMAEERQDQTSDMGLEYVLLLQKAQRLEHELATTQSQLVDSQASNANWRERFITQAANLESANAETKRWKKETEKTRRNMAEQLASERSRVESLRRTIVSGG